MLGPAALFRHPDLMDIAHLAELFADGVTPLLRTDFTDDDAWERVVAAVAAPAHFGYDVGDDDLDDDGYTPNVRPISEPAYAGLTGPDIATAWDVDAVGYVLLADSVTMAAARTSGDPTLVYVDLYDERGRAFRCPVQEVASIEANLAIANMDFEDFAGAVAPDGVFRGF